MSGARLHRLFRLGKNSVQRVVRQKTRQEKWRTMLVRRFPGAEIPGNSVVRRFSHRGNSSTTQNLVKKSRKNGYNPLYPVFPVGKIGVQALYPLFPDDFFREFALYGIFPAGKNRVQSLYGKKPLGKFRVHALYADFPEEISGKLAYPLDSCSFIFDANPPMPQNGHCGTLLWMAPQLCAL
jgi:hypothetical protein